LAQLEALNKFKDDLAKELRVIADAAAAEQQKTAQASSSVSGEEGNVWESARKRELSALVELARMDYMEDAGVAKLLFKVAHLGADEADERQALEASDAWREVAHVLTLYEQLQQNLVVHTSPGGRSKARMFAMLGLELALTLLYIPLFVLAILLYLPPVQPYWESLGVHNHSTPVDLVQKWYARSFLYLAGVRVQWHGLENLRSDQSTIGMFTHASNLDPFIVASGPLAFKWIGKDSIFRIPVIGWILRGLQHISIDRANRESAIESLRKAADIVLRHRRCIAVSPEGTRSRSGRLADFKKGAFHTAMQVGVPITPLLMEGAYDLWPSGCAFACPGLVHCYALPPVDVTPGKDTYNSLASSVRRSVLRTLLDNARADLQAVKSGKKNTAAQPDEKSNFHFERAALFMPLCYLAAFLLFRWLKSCFV
jgi:1-acyl-sn-glycerol-3-phosphate acyltransferase